MAFVFNLVLIVPFIAQFQYPNIAKIRQPTGRYRRTALETVRLAIPDRDLAGFEGFDNRLAIVVRG